MDCFETKDGALYFDGMNTVLLAEEYGTPLFVYSRNKIEDKIKELSSALLDKYSNSRAAYASKAFLNVAMAQIIDKAGLRLDVVSGGELYTAQKAGFPAERIEFHGNNKTEEELEAAIEYGVGCIIMDAFDELSLVEKICKEKGKTVNVMYRVSPNVDAHTHDYISTGKKDSKFGIPLDEDVLYPVLKQAIDSKFVNFLGIHFHIGSQLFENTTHMQALFVALEIYKEVQVRYGYTMEELNIGGGFGIRYVDSDEPKSYAYFIDPIMSSVQMFCKDFGLPVPIIVVEPGRSIVGEAGIMLYRVGSIKNIAGVRKYVSVDGGMSDNIRPALYQAEYEGVIANKADEPAADIVTICGKCCESADKLIVDGKFAKAERGDIVAIFSTGAYGYSMANNYNKNPLPAVVLIDGGEAKLMSRRQTYEDMTRLDIPIY
jgi:diaminopimelate decarboxylase